MDTLILIVVDGLIFAAWLFLISSGLTLVYGVLRILNLAHGSFYALGAYTAAWLVLHVMRQGMWPYTSYLLLLGAALAVGLLLGPLVERGVLRWLYGRDPAVPLLATYALFLILEDVIKLVWGVNPYYAYRPYTLLGQIRIGGISYPGYNVLIFLVALVTGIGLWLFVDHTRFGHLVTAVTYDPEISSAMGVNVAGVFIVAFTLGTALAALGGAFTAPMISVVPGISIEVIVLTFAVVVIGGLGSLPGAALGSLIVGIIRAAAIHLAPEMELFTVYLVMAAVLLVRPHGLLARAEERRI